MALLVPIAEVKPDKCPLAIPDATLVDLLGIVVQLVAVAIKSVSGTALGRKGRQ